MFDAFPLPRLVVGPAIAGAALLKQAFIQAQAHQRKRSAARSLTSSLGQGRRLKRSSAVVAEVLRPGPQIVAHNLKLAANIDHMRDDASNSPSEPCPSPIVPEHGSDGFVR